MGGGNGDPSIEPEELSFQDRSWIETLSLGTVVFVVSAASYSANRAAIAATSLVIWKRDVGGLVSTEALPALAPKAKLSQFGTYESRRTLLAIDTSAIAFLTVSPALVIDAEEVLQTTHAKNNKHKHRTMYRLERDAITGMGFNNVQVMCLRYGIGVEKLWTLYRSRSSGDT